MTKTINPDVAAFKDDFFKGLSFRECVFGGSALLTVPTHNLPSSSTYRQFTLLTELIS